MLRAAHFMAQLVDFGGEAGGLAAHCGQLSLEAGDRLPVCTPGLTLDEDALPCSQTLGHGLLDFGLTGAVRLQVCALLADGPVHARGAEACGLARASAAQAGTGPCVSAGAAADQADTAAGLGTAV